MIGTEHQFGVETAFRGQFEKAASGDSIPVVTIVIQGSFKLIYRSLGSHDGLGGPGTLDTAYNATKAGTPLVVVDGTGQAADILAYAYRYYHGES